MAIKQMLLGAVDNLVSQINKHAVKNKTVTLQKNAIKSITSFATQTIYYFPIATATDVVPDTSGMVAKNAEKAYTVFTKGSMSMIPVLELDDGVTNVTDYLKQFHTNVDVDSPVGWSAQLEAANMPFMLLPGSSLNEATTTLYRGKLPIGTRSVSGQVNDNVSVVSGNVPSLIDDDVNGDGKRIINGAMKFSAEDYSKSTSLTPSAFVAKIRFRGKNVGDVVHEQPVYVKTTIKPINASDMIESIGATMSNRGVFHNLIRWSTGEVSSLADILFGVKDIKRKVAGNNEFDKYTATYENNARLSKMSIPNLVKRDFLPNGSVHLSMNDVQELQERHGVDLLDPKTAVKFIHKTCQLALFISDDMTQELRVIYDGHRSFEVHPYSTVNRDNSSHDKEMKTLIRAIGKM